MKKRNGLQVKLFISWQLALVFYESGPAVVPGDSSGADQLRRPGGRAFLRQVWACLPATP
jgi:hypothetical protein